MYVLVDLMMNGNRMKEGDYAGLTEAIGHVLFKSQYWRDLEMECGYFIRNQVDCSFELNLKCQICEPLQQDLEEMAGHGLNRFKAIEIKIELLTEVETISLVNYVSILNYLLVSLFLNLEIKYPLVFSFYGRKCFKTNYNWITRNLEFIYKRDVTAFSPTKMSAPYKQLMCTFLEKINREYTTITLWRIRGSNSSNYSTWVRYKKKIGSSTDSAFNHTTSLKSTVYTLKLLDCAQILEIMEYSGSRDNNKGKQKSLYN